MKIDLGNGLKCEDVFNCEVILLSSHDSVLRISLNMSWWLQQHSSFYGGPFFVSGGNTVVLLLVSLVGLFDSGGDDDVVVLPLVGHICIIL